MKGYALVNKKTNKVIPISLDWETDNILVFKYKRSIVEIIEEPEHDEEIRRVEIDVTKP